MCFQSDLCKPRRANDQARIRPAGFTFIELIIAMMLLSVVMTLIYTSFGQVSNNVRSLSREMSERQELRLLVKLISDELQAANYYQEFAKLNDGLSGIQAEVEPLDQAEYTKIQFHSSTPTRFYRNVPREADPQMHEIAYWVQLGEDRTTTQLVRREDFYLDDDMSEGGVEVTMAEEVDEFLIEFVAPGAAGRATETWVSNWDSTERTAQDRMPAALRITIAKTMVSGAKIRESQEFNLTAGVLTK